VGAIYARLEGFLPDVCEAVDEHYRPRGAQDAPPRTELGALLAVADRADTLAGFVGVGILPTGSADPYGLRRAASALLDVLYAHRGWLQVDLGRLVEEALQGYGARPDFEAAPRRLAEFLGDRVRAWLLERGFAHDVVDAVLECWRGRVPDFLDALARVEAVAEFRDGPHFPAAYEAFDRAYRIWDKQTRTPPSAPDHPAERGLADAVRSLDPRVTELARGREYRKALELLAQLQGPVAGLFDAVLVNDPDPHLRARRHALLGAVVDLFWKVAHFEHLVVAREA
jgi:glycyl-tRNA synthetase beta chain